MYAAFLNLQIIKTMRSKMNLQESLMKYPSKNLMLYNITGSQFNQ